MPVDRPFLRAMHRAFLIPGMLWPREMHLLRELFSNSRRHAEVGVFCGKSLYITAAAIRHSLSPAAAAEIVAVDNLSERSHNGLEMLPTLKWWQTTLNATFEAIREQYALDVRWLNTSSVEAARILAHEARFDSIFIDANHAEEFVSQDIRSWWSLLAEGGTMAGHDYSAECLGTMNAVNNAFQDCFRVGEQTRIWWAKKDETTDAAVATFQTSR